MAARRKYSYRFLLSNNLAGNSDTKPIFKIGPGGRPNNGDSQWDAKGVKNITRFFISFGEDNISSCINSLQFQYFEDGKRKLTPVYGDNSNHSGSNFEMMAFNHERDIYNKNTDYIMDSTYMELYDEDEYVTRLSGAALNRNNNDNRVTCLTIETSRCTYGPFGSVPAGANKFSFGFGPADNFAGFFGSCSSKLITSIGGYICLDD